MFCLKWLPLAGDGRKKVTIIELKKYSKTIYSYYIYSYGHKAVK
jgi:hypothetical protein